ncbi:MAG: putative toxin-antitoxin system toxin component, PIN family [Flavobacteriales bacterium]|jgi:putative PIN family toxin of toxin-antitoxin system
MKSKQKRVALDTNLWISFLISNKHASLDRLLAGEKILLLFSEELLTEFLEVAQRPKFKTLISTSDLDDILRLLQSKAEFIEVTSHINRCRDPKDNFLLALAENGKADFLVTGDRDLLVLEKHAKTRIISFTNFLHVLG